MGTGFLKRKKEARALQEQFSQMRNQMEKTEVEGMAANGLVNITLGGDYSLKKITIKKECVDPEDVEGLQDLIKAAYMDAHKKIESQPMPGLDALKNLPGFPG